MMMKHMRILTSPMDWITPNYSIPQQLLDDVRECPVIVGVRNARGECSRRVAFNHAELVENKMSGQVAAGVGKSFLVTR